MKRFLRIFAWLVLASILIVTVGPISLRPISGEPADVERFGAFFLVGTLFALAYPRHWLSVLLLTVGCAGAFCLPLTLLSSPPRRRGPISRRRRWIPAFAGMTRFASMPPRIPPVER